MQIFVRFSLLVCNNRSEFPTIAEYEEQNLKDLRLELKKFMITVINYMYETVNFKYSKKTSDIIFKRIEDVIQFMLQIEKVSISFK